MRLKDLGKLDLTSWKGAVSSRASAGTSFLSLCRWKVAVLMPSAARVGPAFLAAPGLIRKPKRRRQYQESARTQFHVGRMGGSPTIVYWMEARVACLRRGVSFGSVRGNRPGSGALLTRLVLRAGGREGGRGGLSLLSHLGSPDAFSPLPLPFLSGRPPLPRSPLLPRRSSTFTRSSPRRKDCFNYSFHLRTPTRSSYVSPSPLAPAPPPLSLCRALWRCPCSVACETAFAPPPLTSPSSPHPPRARLLLP